MMGLIIVIITLSILSGCAYGLGYTTARINSLEKFKVVMDKVHDEALSADFSNEYDRGHSFGLVEAIRMIQDGDVF